MKTTCGRRSRTGDHYAVVVADVTPGEDAMLEAQIQQCMVGTRTLSAALIAWFLEAVWRVDAEEVDSAICDGGGDKGIDALLVDEDAAEITILQSKHRANPGSTTQGDKDLKDLVGASE